jgi:hypothetical protein
MFVILAVVRIYKMAGTGIRWGLLWYPPALALAWVLGWLVAKYFSTPCERWIRRGLLEPKAIAAGAVAEQA